MKNNVYEIIADGTYRATVHSINFIEKSRSSGRPCLKFEFIIEDEPHRNRHEWKYLVTDTEWGKKQTRADLVTCGVGEPRTLGELGWAHGNKVMLEIKTITKNGKEYRNINVKERVEDEPGKQSSIPDGLPF